MEYGPGDWWKSLIESPKEGVSRVSQNFGDFGDEVFAEVAGLAQEWVSRFTVAIGTSGTVRHSTKVSDFVPGTGVVVRLGGDTCGVLTAGHVLWRGSNTKNSTTVALLTASMYGDQNMQSRVIELSPRPCTVDGFDNRTEEGPDIAIIPLEQKEIGVLEAFGINTYNLGKHRWTEQERARLAGKKPWLFSIINGVRYRASEIVYGHRDEKMGSIVTIATNTKVDVARERKGYDYLELPSEITEFSRPTHWREPLPGKAAEEIESLHDEGVTAEVWGGTSGAGVWNLALGTNADGRPDGQVLAELAGICFYANPDKGCVIAHGSKSISKIAMCHMARRNRILPSVSEE